MTFLEVGNKYFTIFDTVMILQGALEGRGRGRRWITIMCEFGMGLGWRVEVKTSYLEKSKFIY